MKRSIFIGYEPREQDALDVLLESLRATAGPEMFEAQLVELDDLRQRGLYWRKHIERDGRLWDVISGAPMSTEFAVSRFATPHLAESGLALFVDCDTMLRSDVAELFAFADPRFAVQVVKHRHAGDEIFKMDGQIQTAYPRKNWSSVVLWNCDHPANKRLTIQSVNSLAGRDLHAFCWLNEDEIGALPPCWNHLVNVNKPDPLAKLAHFTLGPPSMVGDCEFADEWRAHLAASQVRAGECQANASQP